MQLARFLNKIFKKGGFILIDANAKEYIIGEPGNSPIKLKILNKNLHYKLLFHPDLYFGEAYTDGEIVIENGSLTDFLDLVTGRENSSVDLEQARKTIELIEDIKSSAIQGVRQ